MTSERDKKIIAFRSTSGYLTLSSFLLTVIIFSAEAAFGINLGVWGAVVSLCFILSFFAWALGPAMMGPTRDEVRDSLERKVAWGKWAQKELDKMEAEDNRAFLKRVGEFLEKTAGPPVVRDDGHQSLSDELDGSGRPVENGGMTNSER